MTLDALCSAGDVLIYDTFNAAAAGAPTASFGLFGCAGAGSSMAAAAAGVPATAPTAMAAAEGEVVTGEKAPVVQGRRKRRRRVRTCKNREDAESQRMTHIAVERNRRRQMNEYLAVLRSLMPESYVHRGDQASIVGGAIDFVKELEQLLQSLEAQKRTLLKARTSVDAAPMPSAASSVTTASNCSSGSAGGEESAPSACDAAAKDQPPFAQFFTYPQYAWCHPARDAVAGGSCGGGAEHRAGVADIEVNLVETHASVRVMAPRWPGQLLRLVAGLQALRLTVLHLNVTTLDSLALYSLSLKVEEGCGLTTVDDIAAAVHHVLCIIDAEEASQAQQLLAGVAAPAEPLASG